MPAADSGHSSTTPPSGQPLDYASFVDTFTTPFYDGWLFESDLWIDDRQLAALYQRYLAAFDEATPHEDGEPTPVSAVWSPDDIDATWSGNRKLTLTFACAWTRVVAGAAWASPTRRPTASTIPSGPDPRAPGRASAS